MKKFFMLTAIAMALVGPSFAQEKTNDMNVNGRATVIRAWEKNDAVQPAVVKEVKKVSEPAPAVFLTAGTNITISAAAPGSKKDIILQSEKRSTASTTHRIHRYNHSAKKQGSTTTFIRGDGTWATSVSGGGLSSYAADKRSPVYTTSVSSTTTTPSVSYTILGSNTGNNVPTWSNVALAKDVTGEKPKPIKKE